MFMLHSIKRKVILQLSHYLLFRSFHECSGEKPIMTSGFSKESDSLKEVRTCFI